MKVFPNPFNEVTNIRVNLASAADVNVRVMNNLGQEVAFRAYGQLSGDMILPFDATNLGEGVYHLYIQVGDEVITKTVVRAK